MIRIHLIYNFHYFFKLQEIFILYTLFFGIDWVLHTCVTTPVMFICDDIVVFLSVVAAEHE